MMKAADRARCRRRWVCVESCRRCDLKKMQKRKRPSGMDSRAVAMGMERCWLCDACWRQSMEAFRNHRLP